MTEAETRQFREVQAQNKKLLERFALIDARDACDQYFATVRVGHAIRERVTARVLGGSVPLKESGELDRDKLKLLVESETKDECAYIERIAPSGRPFGLGAPPTADPAKSAEEFKESFDRGMKDLAEMFCGEGDENKAKRKAFREGRAA